MQHENVNGIDPLVHIGQMSAEPNVELQNRTGYSVPYQVDYYTAVQQGLQALAMNDKQEQLEIARHCRSIERDENKSRLRREEQYEKQVCRERHMEIIYKNNKMLYVVLDGAGRGISCREVFSGLIQEVKCYRHEDTDDIMWQITIIESNAIRVISPLYQKTDIQSMAKLKSTILGKYDVSDSSQSTKFLWEQLRTTLFSMVDKADVVEIPARPGWYGNDHEYHFYTTADDDITKFSSYMRKFGMNKFSQMGKSEVVEKVLNYLEQSANLGVAGMMLLCRFNVLLGRLTKESCFCTGIALWGENPEKVAYHFLRTMFNDVDTINLDADRMDKIRKNVCLLQDTPAIFCISDSGNRSVQNRLRTIMSWMRITQIEGIKVRAPFVFCFRTFSTLVPIEDMIVVDTSDIVLQPENQSLEMFQFMVVKTIEESGKYWIDEIVDRYTKKRQEGMNESTSLAKTIFDVLIKMFDEMCIGMEVFERFRNLLNAGIREIENQLSRKPYFGSDVFRNQVRDLVDAGSIEIFNRDMAPVTDEESCIYFDARYYYFSNNVLRKICILSKIDKKTMLHIKQELSSLSMIKKYRSTGFRQGEMNIDFRICNAYGQRKDLSGIAVLHEFFDNIGGIELCMRG